MQIVEPTKADQLFINSLPAKLALGEAEGIALCYRLNMVFITHDRKAVNYCQRRFPYRCLTTITLTLPRIITPRP